MCDILQLHTMNYILYTMYYILHTTYYILHTINYIFYTMYYIPHTTYYIHHTSYNIGCNKPGSTLAPYRGSLHCLTEVVKKEGIHQGLFRGLSSTLMREVPQYSIYFPAYDASKYMCASVFKTQKVCVCVCMQCMYAVYVCNVE
jgi:hypothetical protein